VRNEYCITVACHTPLSPLLVFPQENGLAWDANRELMAQGVANVAAGLTGSQPVGGSLSRSLVTRLANAYSPRAAALNGCCLLCLLPMLWVVADAPKCVLAAVVVSQILGTVSDDKRSLRNLRCEQFHVFCIHRKHRSRHVC